jgi:integrase/recombinase XerD
VSQTSRYQSPEAAGLSVEAKDRPLDQAGNGKSKHLTGTAMDSQLVCDLVKRRLKDAGLSPHGFHVAAIINLSTQGVPLEDVLYLAGHAEPPTTACDSK